MTTPNIPDYLEYAFDIDFSFVDSSDNKYDFYVADIGLLKVIDGKIIACDPLLFNNDLPFNTIFPLGHFRVQLAIGKLSNDERVGFSRIKFSDNKPINWTLAVCEGQELSAMEPDEIYGYGVDSGTGAFMDTSGGKEFMKFLMLKQDNYEVIVEDMEKTYKDTWSWLLWDKNECNVAMFSSGWGDGLYATYIGFDNDNNICRLVTDFGMLL